MNRNRKDAFNGYCRRMNRTLGLSALVLLLSWSTGGWWGSPARAFDGDRFAGASGPLLECLRTNLDPKTLKDAQNGIEPKDKKTRMRLKKAYQKCAAATGEGLPKNIAPYSGPLFDAMSQIDETVDHDAAMQQVKSAGVVRLALFARSKKALHENENRVLDLARQYPDLIVPGAPKYFQLSGDISDAFIKATVRGIQTRGYRFIGEILYTHGDKKSGKQYDAGERYVDPSKPGTRKLLEAIAPFNIPLMTHWEPYESERDFPKFHALYDAWPGQIFIVPHMGFASPEQVSEFLSRHPNLYMVISKKDRVMGDFSDARKQAAIGSAFLDGFRLRPEWKDVLIRFQDRLLFGTDPHMKKLWSSYAETISSMRLVLGQLPRDTADRIAFQNAEKLYKVKR